MTDIKQNKPSKVNTNWNIDRIKKHRKVYLIWFVFNLFYPIIQFASFVLGVVPERNATPTQLGATVLLFYFVSSVCFGIYMFIVVKKVVGDYWENMVIFCVVCSFSGCIAQTFSCGQLIALILFILIDRKTLGVIRNLQEKKNIPIDNE
jgi:hypothetical protein